MKQIISERVTRIVFALMMCVIVAVPVFAQSADEQIVNVEFGSTSFDYTYDVAGGWTAAVVPDNRGEEHLPAIDRGTYRLEFKLTGYPLSSVDAPVLPRIFVYPIEAVSGLEAEQVAALSALLAEEEIVFEEIEGAYPFLPLLEADHLFGARAEVVEFKTGRGIAYLTAFGESAALAPLPEGVAETTLDEASFADGQLLYTFQGITTDESRYVAAVFPVSAGDIDVSTINAAVVTALDEAEDSAFAVDLSILRDVFASLKVGDAPETESAPVDVTTDASTDATGPQATSGITEATFQNLTFAFDASIAGSWEAAEVLNNIETAPPGPEMGPNRIAVSFPGYVNNNEWLSPNLFVYKVSDLAGTHEANEYDALNTLLTTQPDLSSYSQQQWLPFLPLMNASQAIHAAEQYLDFGSGTGIRYLTVFSQEAAPFTGERVWYSFQGLTTDGEYYVAAFFPLQTDLLPAEITMDAGDYDLFIQTYDDYIAETTTLLSEAAVSEFFPNVGVLDAMMQSITITGE
jgi:hypothetical protein